MVGELVFLFFLSLKGRHKYNCMLFWIVVETLKLILNQHVGTGSRKSNIVICLGYLSPWCMKRQFSKPAFTEQNDLACTHMILFENVAVKYIIRSLAICCSLMVPKIFCLRQPLNFLLHVTEDPEYLSYNANEFRHCPKGSMTVAVVLCNLLWSKSSWDLIWENLHSIMLHVLILWEERLRLQSYLYLLMNWSRWL